MTRTSGGTFFVQHLLAEVGAIEFGVGGSNVEVVDPDAYAAVRGHSVNVSTPDHMHAPIAMAAMQRGLHVYGQKPLTQTSTRPAS